MHFSSQYLFGCHYKKNDDGNQSNQMIEQKKTRESNIAHYFHSMLVGVANLGDFWKPQKQKRKGAIPNTIRAELVTKIKAAEIGIEKNLEQ